MGDLHKVMMKRRRRKSTTILNLPSDMLVSIISSVASSSIADLIDAKLVCKRFNEASLDYFVFNRLTLETMPFSSRNSYSTNKSLFLNRCEASANPDALYNLAMYHYFSSGEFELGHDLLRKSANMGHHESIYMLGMILFADESTRLEAIELCNKIENQEIHKCRLRAKKTLRNLWINHHFHQQESLCTNSSCRNGGMKGLPNKQEWSRSYEEDWFCSDSCKWSFEFWKVFG